MPRNPQIDHLRETMDRAYHTRQSALQHMKSLGQRRYDLKEKLDASWEGVSRARDEMNAAYARQQSEYEAYRSERDDISAQIDSVGEDANRAHEAMKDAYERASNAFESSDHADASFHSQEARDYRYDRDSYNEEKRRLIDIAKSMSPPHGDEFHRCREIYNDLMGSHKSIQDEYREVKTQHEAAKAGFDYAKQRHEEAREAYDRLIAEERAKWHDEKCQECGDTIRVNVEWSHPPKYCKACKEKFAKQREEAEKQRKNQDYLIANLRARSNHIPIRTGEGGKVENSTMYVRGPKAGLPIHVTQVYADGWHISWNAMPDGTVSGVHWTHHRSGEQPGTSEPDDARVSNDKK